jgi:hypothetical protein
MKKFLAFALVLLGCGVTVPTAGTHYSTPALILSPGGGRTTACYGVVTIEQVTPGTYNVYWIGADHKTHVIRGVHDVVVTYPPPGDTTCS